jgi:hypothetical protein
MFGVFLVTDCCGEPVDVVKIPVDIDSAWRDEDNEIDDFTFCNDYRSAVLIAGGFSHGRCGACGDSAYRVKVSHLINANGRQVKLCDV